MATSQNEPHVISIAARMSGKWTEAGILATLIVGAIAVLVSVSTYPAGSWEYPSAIAAGILTLAIWLGGELLASAPLQICTGEGANVDEADDSIKEDLPLQTTLVYAAIITAFVLSLYYVWFPIAAFVAGVVTFLLVFRASWLNAVMTAALVSGISSTTFYLLEVPLPGSGF